MQVVTMKADRAVGSITVPSGTPGVAGFQYKVRENGTVEVPEAHVPHLRGAGFVPMEEIENDRLREISHEERVKALMAELAAEKARADAAEAKVAQAPKDSAKK